MVDFTLAFMALQTISITIGVIYHIMTLRNTKKNQELTLETRQAQMFMQMQNRFTDSMRDIQALDVIQNAKFDTFDEFLELISTDEIFTKVIRGYGSFFESLGVLVKEGLIDVRLVALMWGGPTRMFWELIEPIVEDWRISYKYPRMWSETEYVCKEVLKYMDENPILKT
jgi:hypothetical protein